MIDAPVGMTSQILKGGFKAGRFVWVRRKERRETDALVREALKLALCPTDPEGSATAKAACALADCLSSTEFPPEANPGWRERRLPKALRRPFGGVDDGESAPFSARLQAWIGAAATGEMAPWLASGSCDGHPVEPEVLAERFGTFFRASLVERPTSFRLALAREIHDAESFQRWRAKAVREKELAVAASASAGVGAAAIAEAAGSGDAVIIGLGAALVTGLTGLGAVQSLRRREPSSLRDAARAIASAWVADLLRIAGRSAPSVTAWPSLAGLAAGEGEVPVPDEMAEDLVERLIPVAREAGDEDLVAALRRVEDVLAGHRRGRNCHLGASLASLLAVTGEAAGAGPGCGEAPQPDKPKPRGGRRA